MPTARKIANYKKNTELCTAVQLKHTTIVLGRKKLLRGTAITKTVIKQIKKQTKGVAM